MIAAPLIGYGCAALALVGIAYQLVAAWALSRFFAAPQPPPLAEPPAISLLKPLHGAEPRLGENLASFLAQDYPAPVQMVLGVNTPEDSALGEAEALAKAQAGADIAIWRGPRIAGANGKMGNCAAIMPLARHDLLVLSDSDMAVAPDYLARIAATLARPGVGAVSCLYVGRGDAGFWSDLGAAMISYQTTPNIVLAAHFGLDAPCMGSTIAMRRETLEAIGGFGAFTGVLADDYAIGAAVRAGGQAVALPAILLTHAGVESSWGALWRQRLRWAVTIRDLRLAGHIGSIITLPLPFALAAMALVPGGWLLALAALAVRLHVAAALRARANRPCAPLWMVPLGDIISFTIFCASLFASKIDWRGTGLTMAGKGRITPSAAARHKRET